MLPSVSSYKWCRYVPLDVRSEIHLISQRELLYSVVTEASRAVQPDHLPTLEVSGVGAVAALPSPGVVQPPYQLSTKVAPRRMVTWYLPPVVSQPTASLTISPRPNKERLHLNGLA